ncbi:hypothetical protein COLO4_12870 [Corchorus olitorius]|uniref:F-box domain-containing protein n=1 Tax=Corchorus olitorius TaxID=93759 RepID=A0A1R3JZB3_9ROSI|nr:hypothetical protein COLO4_12870 [Corchorus olitorius]
MSTFPTDLITDILCQLPVKTLLRFKCVSKPWGSLIDDQDFAKLHLHQSLKTNTNIKLLLDNRTEIDEKAYSVDFDSFRNLVPLPRPFRGESDKYYSRIFGSCDGLLAVYHHESDIALWNPSTRKCNYLPTLSDNLTKDLDLIPRYGYHRNVILGFGYDVTNNDYKVVQMLRHKTRNCFEVMVYSLKANSWRKIKDCPYDVAYNYNDGAYLNGSLHWVGGESGDFIFGLRLGDEEYFEVPEVKTLLRFKCVSKPWGSLIDDPDFAKLHLNQSLKTNTNIKLFLDNCTEIDEKAYLVDFDSLCNLVQLPRPFRSEANNYRSRIFGSQNGLLAVYHEEAGIALWNPSTRKCHYLPPLSDDLTKDLQVIPSFGINNDIILGFGYDVTNNDYKVVKMLRHKTRNRFQVMVYSLKTNSWKKIKDCPYDIPYNYNDGAHLNGSLHWEGGELGDQSCYGDLIFGLHLGDEEYFKVPECDTQVRDFDYKNVGVLGECLCVFRDGSTGWVADNVALWVMKEYGVKESWKQLIYLSRDEWGMMINIFHTRAVGYSKSGDKILLDDNGFKPVWCNLETKTGETLYIPGAPERVSTRIYVESLVSVN